jgi:HEPN domain-containing protein
MPDRIDHTRGWLRKGDSDLVTVQALLRAGGPFDTATYHAQQAAEKYLKAALAFAEEAIPRTHNLEVLEQLCARAFPTWQIAKLDLTKVTAYAVEGRYDSEFWPDDNETKQALAVAEAVRFAVVAVLPPSAIPI